MEVHLDHEKNPWVKDPERVEVTVKTATQTLRVHGEGTDHFAAIDVAVDKLEAQLRKVKGRLASRVHRNGERQAVIEAEPDEDGPRFVRRPQALVKPLTPDE